MRPDLSLQQRRLPVGRNNFVGLGRFENVRQESQARVASATWLVGLSRGSARKLLGIGLTSPGKPQAQIQVRLENIGLPIFDMPRSSHLFCVRSTKPSSNHAT
jgi:hypothetical protein